MMHDLIFLVCLQLQCPDSAKDGILSCADPGSVILGVLQHYYLDMISLVCYKY